MSTRSTTGKTKTSTKPAAKSPSRAAGKAKAGTPARTKSRLAGPKPPKSRKKTQTPEAAAPARAPQQATEFQTSRTGTGKIPAPETTPGDKMPSPLPVELKKPELIDLVVTRSEIKKKYAKPVVEAMLEILGETLSKGREMNLQPLGKVKYNRTKETTSARVVVTKIRQSKPAKARSSAPKDPLADAAE
ncbi:HU family DNA-binding protein [Roseovarius sp. CAU 1744]|uniref:HU family DNA-binding protein n=1 Tax=Roseovarius sp. CAU 1744 TaxID=3140368 RepID=UPI00325BC728